MGDVASIAVERERFSVISSLLKTDTGRDALKRAGHAPGGYLVAAHCDERISDVMGRVAESRTREVVLVAYAKSRRALLLLEPGHTSDAQDAETVGGDATLGMLVDAMSHAGNSTTWNITVSAWKSAVATSREPVTLNA